jgi:2-polyprenyl-3-methyl-5-hydroxy-6-metoxy-1,4-benzoquinol methylase
MAKLGCVVEAWDISEAALRNARAAWPDVDVRYVNRDALAITNESRHFDIILAYGLLHCLPQQSILSTISHMRRLTEPNGYNIIVCYNERLKEGISMAHPGFRPSYLGHQAYVDAYIGWKILQSSDEDLHESHPTNMICHAHSMTRILAQKPTDR